MDDILRQRLHSLATTYETEDFLQGDPSWFMHQVKGALNQEMMGFLASVLSYGKRSLFFPKIQFMLDRSRGEVQQWVASRAYREAIPDNRECYYRLYNNHMMLSLLDALADMLDDYGSIGGFVRRHSASHKSYDALIALSDWFLARGIKSMVPSPRTSVAKRPVMFMRWMVRSASPVDLGLWADYIDRSSLYIPLDTHVIQESLALGLIHSRSASWHTVVSLTEAMREVFPDDPARGDFALFGYGVSKERPNQAFSKGKDVEA